MTPARTISPRSWRQLTPAALWASLALIFVACHYKFYFVWRFYEGGDLAANALQIRNAKQFHELYGNYSRFGFHHPGPGFFYVYAAAERLLFDFLKIVPDPFAAHALAGVLLQLVFFTWALSIVAKRVQRPLVVPLLLLFAAIHFGLVNHFIWNAAFQSIWPPHVLLMPFLCLLVAGASLASGNITELVPLALSGAFLVHGHVAQPLFVVPLTILGYAGWLRNRAPAERFWTRAVTRAHCVAGAIIALFLLPIVIDAFRGKQSNLWLIIQHLTQHAGERKTIAQSLVYFVSFFCDVLDTERFCDHITRASFEFLRGRWYMLVLWLFVSASTVAVVRHSSRAGSLAAPRFVRWLAIYVGASVGLTLIWGLIQTDALLEFNSHFNFAILFLVFVILAIGLASFPSVRSANYRAGGVFALALPMMFFASRNMNLQPDFAGQPPRTPELDEQIRHAVEATRQQPRTKFLLFDDWGEAARVALTLTRLHYPFRVPAGWEPVFGRTKGVDVARAFASSKFAIWKVRNASVGQSWLTTSPKEINPNGDEILFSSAQANAQQFFTYGWDISTGIFSWSTEDTALVRFKPLRAEGDVRIECELADSGENQRMSMAYNGSPPRWLPINRPATTAVLLIPAAVWNENPAGALEFRFPNAASPLSRGISDDPRKLGCAFVRIRFTTVTKDAG